MMDKEKLTVDSFKKILDELSVHGYRDMSILLGSDTPLSQDSISIRYMTNDLLIRNTYYDKKLVSAAEKLKDNIDENIKQYLSECYHAGMNIKADKMSDGKEMNKEYCEFCVGGKALVIDKTNDVGIAIQYPNRLIAYGYDIYGLYGLGSNHITIKINYCPMCGRRLMNRKEINKK